MIEWAMLFALGAFSSGLLALAMGAIVVRRTRRVTERRVRAMLAARRGEFAVERDQERVRFAVEMRRLEREAAILRDQATAHRLDADIKEQELFNLRAEVSDREVEVQDLSGRLSDSQSELFDTERRLVETSAALRAAQHALDVEIRRRTTMQRVLDETSSLADERRLEIMALRAENEDIRDSLERLRSRLAELGDLRWTRPAPHPESTVPLSEVREAEDDIDDTDGRVVPLRPHQPEILNWLPVQPGEKSPDTEHVERIAAEINRIAGEAAADLERIWRVPAVPSQRQIEKPNGTGHRVASGNGKNGRGRRKDAVAVGSTDVVTQLRPAPQDNSTAEARFLEALEEIRSLRRAGGANPGE